MKEKPPLKTEDVTAFGEHAEYTGVRSDDRKAWLALRSTMLTASDVPALMGEDERRTALDVYVDKTLERRSAEPERLLLDDPRFWGLELEQPILRAVARFHGWNYRPGGFLLRSRMHPHLGATLDAEVDRGAGWLDFEGKTSRIPRGWDEDSGELPTRVLIQVQTQLLVTGAPAAIVFALLQGSRPCQVEVFPSPEFHEHIVAATAEFMARLAELDPPEPVGTQADRRALSRLYPLEDGSVVALPHEAVEWTRAYQAAAADETAAKKRKEKYAQLLKRHVGAASYGLLPEPVGGKSCWRWETQEREAYAVEPGASRVLRALKDPPPGAPPHRLAAPANDVLLSELRKSVEEPAPARIRIGTTSRRRRR